jgi:hypothetical protein
VAGSISVIEAVTHEIAAGLEVVKAFGDIGWGL